jgi:Fe-S-cluster containining protein
MLSSEEHVKEWSTRSTKQVDQLNKVLQQYKDTIGPSATDNAAQSAHIEVYDNIDCLDCGNCCRTSVTDFDNSDIKRVSKHLKMSKKAFIKKYLIEDFDGKHVTITSPCPFLELSTNACMIYDVRPSVCASYPHTDKAGFNQRKNAHSANLDMCPITFHVVKKMEEALKNWK